MSIQISNFDRRRLKYWLGKEQVQGEALAEKEVAQGTEAAGKKAPAKKAPAKKAPAKKAPAKKKTAKGNARKSPTAQEKYLTPTTIESENAAVKFYPNSALVESQFIWTVN